MKDKHNKSGKILRFWPVCMAAVTLSFPSLSARAEPGDRINTRNFSFGEGIVPTGAAFDNSERKLYYIDDAHDQIFKVDPANNYQAAPGTVVANLETGDEYFGLGFANISGTPFLAASNVTDCELEIYNALTGAQVNSKVMPGTPGGPLGPKGVTHDGENWNVFIANPPFRIENYNISTLYLEGEIDLSSSGMSLGNSEITFDSQDKLFYIIKGTDKGFYTFDENLHNVNYWEFNPGTSLDLKGAAFDEDNLELISTSYASSWADIIRYEGYDTPPTPTPSPTPAPTPIYITDSGDYNGDGISDIGIFRPSSGRWSIRGITRTYFGGIDDRPVGGDYDNDGRTDLAVYRGRSGLWAIRGLTRVYYGGVDDIPAPGDYNGDGRCDIGVFRGSSGLWAIRGLTRFYFGSGEDWPVPGYFGGARAKSAAVFRPATGRWWVRGLSRFYFGGSLDFPWAGDFAGTGDESAGVFRGSVGLWGARAITRFYYGADGDCPVPGDYNGLGESEAGLFRPPVGLWAIRGLTRAYFGHSGDLPVAGRPCRPLTPTPTASPSPTPQTGSPTPTTTSTPAPPSPTPSTTPTPEGYKTPIPTPSVMPTVEPLVESSNSGCLAAYRTQDEPESLEVFWDTGHIAVRHYNAEYNCCLERVDVEMQVEGTEIRLYETEIVPIYCYCLCPYNVFSDISPVAPGEYTVSVYRMGTFWQSATVEVPEPTP